MKSRNSGFVASAVGPAKAARAAFAASGGMLARSERRAESPVAQTLSKVEGRDAVQLMPIAAMVRRG